MAFDALKERAGGDDTLSPYQIINDPLLTAREKLDLLHRLKAEVSDAAASSTEIGFDPEEIDDALAELHRGAEDGVGSQTVWRGDF